MGANSRSFEISVEIIWVPRGFLVILYSQHTCGASDKGICGGKRSAQHIASIWDSASEPWTCDMCSGVPRSKNVDPLRACCEFCGGIFYQKYSRHFRPSGSLHGRSTGKSDMTLRAWSRWLTILRLPACVSTFEAYVESLRSREGLVRTVMTGVFSISFRFSLW